jgi:hypothetical protein
MLLCTRVPRNLGLRRGPAVGRVTRKSDERRPSALEVFTDREGFIDEFDRLLAAKDPEDNDVLVFYGEGGIGKSTLSRKLQQRLTESGSGHLSACLDFADSGNTAPDYALFRLKEKFSSVALPTVDGTMQPTGGVDPEGAKTSDSRGSQ